MNITKFTYACACLISFLTLPLHAFVYGSAYTNYIARLEKQAKKYGLLNIKKPYAHQVAQLLSYAHAIIDNPRNNEMRIRQDLQRVTWELAQYVNNEKGLKDIKRYHTIQRFANKVTGLSRRNKNEFYQQYENYTYHQLVRELDMVNYQIDNTCASKINIARLFDKKTVVEDLMKKRFLHELRTGNEHYIL